MTAGQLKQIKYWTETYGNSGAPDQRAVETFMDCENRESIAMLRNELSAVTKGAVADASLDALLKANRKQKHGSYPEWAKLMLLWMANYKGYT